MIRKCIRADYSRFEKKNKLYFLVRLIHYPSFRLLVVFRIIQGIRCKLLKSILMIYYRHLERKYLIDLPLTVKLGKGCFFPHNGPVIFNPAAVIGENCSIHPCTLIGTIRGEGGGVPIVGNNVFIGHGAKLFREYSCWRLLFYLSKCCGSPFRQEWMYRCRNSSPGFE